MNQHGNLKFSGKANYRITVKGRLNKSWSSQLSGMSITHESQPGNTETSILLGEIADQAALSGVLNALYDMHLAVLSVEYIDTNSDE